MKVRVYHKDGVAFTVHNVVAIIDQGNVITVSYITGFGIDERYLFKKEDIEKMRIED